MVFSPFEHDYRNIYKLMIGSIVPRPIPLVSTVSPDGIHNLAPFSYFTAVSGNPPAICFCPLVRTRDGSVKDTLRNIRAMREFVVNIVPERLAEQMNVCSVEFPPDIDEFHESGLTPVASDLVRPARVKESPINMECRLLQILEISAKPLGGSIVIGEVIRFHVEDSLVDNYTIDPDALNAIGRMGGPNYTRTTNRFTLVRPNAGEIKVE